VPRLSYMLVLGTTAIAAAMWWNGRATMLEAVSFVTGALCVWLTVKEDVWNFPIGLINVATFSVVFYRAGLVGDAGLQVVYFVLGIVGWYRWLHGGARGGKLHVNRVRRGEAITVIVAGVALQLLLWNILPRLGGSASFWDATTTSLSLCAQWLLNGKRLESWYCWIAVDVIYIPLYAYKGLYLTAGLYAVFLCLATMGLMQWHRTWKHAAMEDVRGAGAIV